MRRRAGVIPAVAIVAALTGATLAGCGSDNPYDLPEYESGEASGASAPSVSGAGTGGATSAPAPSETESIPTVSRAASPASTDVTYSPADARGEGAWVERGKVRAGTADAKSAVDAVVGYMEQRVRISNTWTVDEAALAAVASGPALTSAQERAASQQAAGRRSVGRFVVNVSSVRGSGDTLTVTGCHFDATSELDENGYVLVPPPGGMLIRMKVQKAQGVWKVTSWPTKEAPTCEGWKK
ncbi:hypothetical protein [Kineosporia succinea]|uniref:Small lipoprotein YifL n=1 Tax=Kineosporia succinea TaxID=84632 RepID=A0ABT9P4V6_9ACTN|nr:hypothetical protein [Kineosporia succinea]MDP9827703.1 putative small lipoprotein YifL [Kineosporia succinea]